jgi:hypothetical protein
MAQRKQSRRVAAWLYVVINPIIDSLEHELSFLNSGNLTWRSRTGQCEIIKTIQEYVDPGQWPNYQVFVVEYKNSPLLPGFKQHDSNLDAVNTAAKNVYVWLLNSKLFTETFEATLQQYESQRASMGPAAQSLVDMKQSVREEVVQHIINNVPTLPSHYVISSFWNFSSKNFRAWLTAPEFQPLHRSTEKLLETSAKLKQMLEAFRLTLSREYDVPAAPVPGISFEG